eukprot:1192476-Prorocentrum_minimum.AAC.3
MFLDCSLNAPCSELFEDQDLAAVLLPRAVQDGGVSRGEPPPPYRRQHAYAPLYKHAQVGNELRIGLPSYPILSSSRCTTRCRATRVVVTRPRAGGAARARAGASPTRPPSRHATTSTRVVDTSSSSPPCAGTCHDDPCCPALRCAAGRNLG